MIQWSISGNVYIGYDECRMSSGIQEAELTVALTYSSQNAPTYQRKIHRLSSYENLVVMVETDAYEHIRKKLKYPFVQRAFPVAPLDFPPDTEHASNRYVSI